MWGYFSLLVNKETHPIHINGCTFYIRGDSALGLHMEGEKAIYEMKFKKGKYALDESKDHNYYRSQTSYLIATHPKSVTSLHISATSLYTRQHRSTSSIQLVWSGRQAYS